MADIWWDDDDWVTAPEWFSQAHLPRGSAGDVIALQCGSLIDASFVRWTKQPTEERCERCETARTRNANGHFASTDTGRI